MTTKNSNGSYYKPLPLDFELLERMPEKGMIGGLHWRGRRARDIRADMLEAHPDLQELLTVSMVQSRLRSMNVAGYVENFASIGAGGSVIWARTTKGSEFLKQKEEVLGG